MTNSVTDDNIRIVELVVVGNPSSNEPPSCFNSGVSAKSGGLHGLSAYSKSISSCKKRCSVPS